MRDYTELALHEAGHCVAALEYEHDFSIVSLHSDKGYSQEGSSAHVKLSPLVEKNIRAAWGKTDPKSRATIVSAAIVYMAGAYAVRQAANDKGIGMPWDIYGATSDYEKAWALLPGTGVSWQWLQRKTRLFVALNWPSIISVASALRERKVMTRHDIQRVIDEKED